MTKGLWRSDKPPIGKYVATRYKSTDAPQWFDDNLEWLDERFIQHDGGPCPVDPDAMVVWWYETSPEDAKPTRARFFSWGLLGGCYYRIVSSTERVPEAEKSVADAVTGATPVSVDPNAKMIERDLVEPIVKAAPAPVAKPAPDPFPVSSDDLSRQGWLLGGRFGGE